MAWSLLLPLGGRWSVVSGRSSVVSGWCLDAQRVPAQTCCSDPRPEGTERSVDIALTVARLGGSTRKNILLEAAILREVAHAHAIRLLDVRASTPGGEEDPQ